jgi:hypothetical protein
MTWRKREIMDMAREAGFIHNMEAACTFQGNFAQIEAFAALVREDEREAWWKQYRDGSVEVNEARTFIAEDAIATGRRPLVFGDTTPPPVAEPHKRTWVGLTDDEIRELVLEFREVPITLTFAIEAKLKEKNT